MFKQAYYNGRSKILSEMAQYKISQDTLDIVQKIGPRRFLTLAKSDKLIDTILWQEYTEWFITCPDVVKDILGSIFNRQSFEVNDETWITTCCKLITLLDLEEIIEFAPEWYETAPKDFRCIMDKALNDYDVLGENPCVGEIVTNYLLEAISVAQWARLIKIQS